MLSADEQAAFLTSIDNVQRRAGDYLDRHHDPSAPLTYVRHLQAGVSQVFEQADRTAPHLACRAGCSHCCAARVEAIAPEIFLIADALRNLDSGLLAGVVDRMTEHQASAAPQSSGAWRQDRSCPLLIDNLCSIYPRRPAACRKAHSLDVSACASRAATLPQKLDLSIGAEALMRGSANAFDARGLDGTAYELISAVLQVLRDPSAQARWLQGERVFEGDIGGA